MNVVQRFEERERQREGGGEREYNELSMVLKHARHINAIHSLGFYWG